jgi:hypothetical protein
MGKIAKENIEGEPVVDYDAELSTLYISDPFFAYFLRWGMEEPSGWWRFQRALSSTGVGAPSGTARGRALASATQDRMSPLTL